MTVICNNKNCQYNSSNFCKRKSGFTVLNGFAQCKIWYADNGSVRPQPLYPIAESEVSEPEKSDEKKKEAED